ncbi:MAG TPA: hypothetical protein VKB73_10020 [Gaiellaceae bacterium]|nr:hypothetical protein [Gaiellaceae bacterium]
MFNRSLKARSVIATGTAVATLGIAAPLATADPAPVFIPQTQQAPPNSLRQNAPRLGEGLTGADRSWLAPSTVTMPSSGFNWGDAGIGAGTTALVLLIAGGSVVVIRRRVSTAQ